MMLATQRGFSLTILAVTDGEASHARSSVITPAELVVRRLRELRQAYAALHIRPERIRLGLQDAGVQAGAVRSLLPKYVDQVAAVFAPLPNDGHPDHDACGQAARAVAAAMGVRCLSYPVWAHHRPHADGGEEGILWRVDLPPAVLRAKQRAMACFVSQFQPLGPAPEDGPVLPPGFRTPFERPCEVLFT
jgi:LmbE family N-acetylglucosaminyl deacetylase